MEYKVVLFEEAEQDLENIYSYIAINCLEPIYVGNLINKIKNAIKSLSTFPYRHSLCEYPLLKETRKFVISGYIILYMIDGIDRIVTIIGIISCKRDFEKMYITNQRGSMLLFLYVRRHISLFCEEYSPCNNQFLAIII